MRDRSPSNPARARAARLTTLAVAPSLTREGEDALTDGFEEEGSNPPLPRSRDGNESPLARSARPPLGLILGRSDE